MNQASEVGLSVFYESPEFRQNLQRLQNAKTIAVFTRNAHTELDHAVRDVKRHGVPVDPMLQARSNRTGTLYTAADLWVAQSWEATSLRAAATLPVLPAVADRLEARAAEAEQYRDSASFPEGSKTYPANTLDVVESRFRAADADFFPVAEVTVIDAITAVKGVWETVHRDGFGSVGLPPAISTVARHNAAALLELVGYGEGGRPSAMPYAQALSEIVAGMPIDKYPSVRRVAQRRAAASAPLIPGTPPPAAQLGRPQGPGLSKGMEIQ
jgi:hypothetical protein